MEPFMLCDAGAKHGKGVPRRGRVFQGAETCCGPLSVFGDADAKRGRAHEGPWGPMTCPARTYRKSAPTIERQPKNN